VSENKDSTHLYFSNGTVVEADIVILAIPFSVLRTVDIKAKLPGKLRQFIKTVDLGRNEKVHAGFKERIWRQNGFSLDAWSDLGFSEVWDGGQRQSDRTDGVLSYFLGGNEVNALNDWPGGVAAAGAAFSERLSQFVSGLDQHASGQYARTNWMRNPYSRGAYVNYKPGQLTRFGEYLWVESDNPEEQQSVNVGRLVFAGEQLSDEYYGFMNGAAQTGRLAAQLVQHMLQSNYTRKHND
jgi:monoamine oxidase